MPKLKNPITIKDFRKISCTSDFSKLFERFLRNWILEDIEPNLDPAQYGNQKGTGTNHMLISLVDKIPSHLDNNLGSPGVLATMLDWSAAFDRQCPTLYRDHKIYESRSPSCSSQCNIKLLVK